MYDMVLGVDTFPLYKSARIPIGDDLWICGSVDLWIYGSADEQEIMENMFPLKCPICLSLSAAPIFCDI